MTNLKTKTPLITVAAFGAGAILFAFEGRLLPEVWIASTYGCFAASTFFGILAWRQGKRWPLILAALSASIIIVTGFGFFFMGRV